MLRRTLICFISALLLAGPASAGQIVVTLGLAPGKLQVRSARTSPTTVLLTVADGRGSGAGWTLRASEPVTVTGITARCAAGSTCTLPRAKTVPAGQVVLKASRDSGMGVMSLAVTLGAQPDGAQRAPVTFTVS